MSVFSRFIDKVVGPKGPWRSYKARAAALPPDYRAALEALERYLNYLGPGGDGGAVLEDLTDLFEQSVAAGTRLREVVGEDPVAFIEGFVENYPDRHWRARERERFIKTIERAERDQEQR